MTNAKPVTIAVTKTVGPSAVPRALINDRTPSRKKYMKHRLENPTNSFGINVFLVTSYGYLIHNFFCVFPFKRHFSRMCVTFRIPF